MGSARTEFQQPVSQYASALEGIAGEPVAHDPSAKYAPALGALTGDAPPSGQGTGVVGAVTAAAGNVYHGVAQVGGLWPPGDAAADLIYEVGSNTVSSGPMQWCFYH